MCVTESGREREKYFNLNWEDTAAKGSLWCRSAWESLLTFMSLSSRLLFFLFFLLIIKTKLVSLQLFFPITFHLSLSLSFFLSHPNIFYLKLFWLEFSFCCSLSWLTILLWTPFFPSKTIFCQNTLFCCSDWCIFDHCVSDELLFICIIHVKTDQCGSPYKNLPNDWIFFLAPNGQKFLKQNNCPKQKLSRRK